LINHSFCSPFFSKCIWVEKKLIAKFDSKFFRAYFLSLSKYIWVEKIRITKWQSKFLDIFLALTLSTWSLKIVITEIMKIILKAQGVCGGCQRL